MQNSGEGNKQPQNRATSKISFLGAAQEVTGTCYLVKGNNAHLLVDCGMFQGHAHAIQENVLPKEIDPNAICCVLLTHAHLDHSGRLPLLVKAGYKGPIYCTSATAELTDLILRDAAKVQLQDIQRINRKRMRANEPPIEPLFLAEDVAQVRALFKELPYDTPVKIADNITATFVEAGHLLGSASVILQITNNYATHTFVFSGDLGQKGAPLLRDPASIPAADTVILESTYGNRDHKSLQETVDEFESIVVEAVKRKGKILVPTFAVGRAQVLLYVLAILFREKKIPKFPVYLDSPMAIEATRIYMRHLELLDEEFQTLNRDRPINEDLSTVTPVVTAQESMALNEVEGPCMILAGAGMCNAGRILHHLKHNLWKPETSVIIVGYQARGTLGRSLVEGAEYVHIFGEKIAVKAKIHTLGGFSAHAGQRDLLNWVRSFAHCKPRIFLTHGEPDAMDALAQKIQEQFGLPTEKPGPGTTVELHFSAGCNSA